MPARSTRHASRPKKLSPPVAPDSAECSQTCDPIPLDVCEMLLAQAITDYEGSDLYANSAASPSRAGSSAGRSSAQWSDPGVSYTGQDTWLEPAYDYPVYADPPRMTAAEALMNVDLSRPRRNDSLAMTPCESRSPLTSPPRTPAISSGRLQSRSRSYESSLPYIRPPVKPKSTFVLPSPTQTASPTFGSPTFDDYERIEPRREPARPRYASQSYYTSPAVFQQPSYTTSPHPVSPGAFMLPSGSRPRHMPSTEGYFPECDWERPATIQRQKKPCNLVWVNYAVGPDGDLIAPPTPSPTWSQ